MPVVWISGAKWSDDRGVGVNFIKCSIDGCNEDAFYKSGGAKGYCCGHYKKYRRHGTATPEPKDNSVLVWLRNAIRGAGEECIDWPFFIGNGGYGQMRFLGSLSLAHRVSCLLSHGEGGIGLDAAHSCGNRGCVNPNHLRWTTRSDNCADKIHHGTHARGERSPLAKLTNAQVESLRLGELGPIPPLAKELGVDKSTLYKARSGASWSWM